MSFQQSPLRLSDSVSSRVSMALRKAASRGLPGFTLAELIVVVAILAVLATVGLLALSGYREDARDAAVKANVRSVYSAIMAESSARQESPRCFVVHDPAYALSGGVVVFDSGLADSLSGWPCGTPGTNYSAWNPDYAALKLDPEKFRLSLLSPGFRGTPPGSRPAPFPAFRPPFLPASAAGTGSADPSLLLVGAADLADLSWPKPRIRTFAQVAAVLSSETAYVAGDFPTGGAEDGSAAGLVKDAAFASSSTGALVDGAPVGAPAPCPESEVSGYAVPRLGNGESAEVSKDVGNGRWTATASCSYGTVRIRDEAAVCDPDHVPASPAPSCVRDSCSGTLPENALSNGTAGTASWSRSETPGTCTFECDSANGYLWNSGTLSCEKSCDTGNLASHAGLGYVLPVALTVPNGASASSTGTHAFGASPADGELSASFAFSCASGTLGTESSSGSASCASAPAYAFNSDFAAPACLPVAYAVSGSFGAGASGAQVTGCQGRTATADASGNFSFSGVLHGTDCSDVSVSKAGYLCSVSDQGPGSLVSGVSDVAWSCSFDLQGLAGSLRFNGTNGYLSRTWGSWGNQNLWTLSSWVKLWSLSSTYSRSIHHVSFNGDAGEWIGFSSDNKLYLRRWVSWVVYSVATDMVFRDPSAWYHVVVVYDSANSTSSERVRFYVNGSRVSASGTFPSLNQMSGINGQWSPAYYVGRWTANAYATNEYLDGYLSELSFIDGQASLPTAFGETDPATGSWRPKQYSGSYGNNGFRLSFSDASSVSALGLDSSGRGNHWTPANFTVTDRVIDAPTNNFATLNPLDKAPTNTNLPQNGNLKFANTANYQNNAATMAMTSGKWYFEMSPLQITDAVNIGIINENANRASYPGADTNGVSYWNGGHKYYNSSQTAGWGTSYGISDTAGLAYDADAGTLTAYKNGLSQGILWSGMDKTKQWKFAVSGKATTSNGLVNFGQWGQSGLQYCENAGGYFKYCPPSGFKALSTKNLPTPAIANPKQHFDVLTYVGNGSPTPQSNTVSWLSFQPDLLWFKNRDAAAGNAWMDSIRGWNKVLYSYSSTTESTEASSITFPSVGSFTIPSSYGWSWNDSGNKYVAWAWKGGTPAPNSDGTIPSQVSANPAAGFSIATYLGNGSTGTIGHWLGQVPKMVVVKNRDTVSTPWAVWHSGIANTEFLYLNSTSAKATGVNLWNSVLPTSSAFSVGSAQDTNYSTKNFVAYVFAEVPGFSKFGTYAGTANADGPFVHTGFRPRWIMLKRIDSSGSGWYVYDTARNTWNQAGARSFADSSWSEWLDSLDILSNGFKWRDAGGGNAAGTWIYAAFAEVPFWGAGIAPATAR